MMKPYLIIALFLSIALGFTLLPKKAVAYYCNCATCTAVIEACSITCGNCETAQENGTKQHFTDELANHKIWMTDFFFLDEGVGDPAGLLAAMKLMTNQLSAQAILQVQIIGSFFDAKHQLETQRLFQTLVARAHKDYQPSEELCTIGTAARPLAASERKTNLVSTALARRAMDRQLLSANNLGMTDGVITDKKSRLVQFIKKYCNPKDNSGNLDLLCKKGGGTAAEQDKDINYTATMDYPLTLNIDFNDPAVSSDEEAIFALTAYLVGHESMPAVAQELLLSKNAETYSNQGVLQTYIDSRALAAKRSVATNSLAAIASLKSNGNPEAKPFIYAIINELSPDNLDVEKIQQLIGENPSYYAQMEILTKKLYQNPKFYSDLYDKPANVLRKDVAIQAADLMQKRDIYRSFLRSEAVLATMLETALIVEQESIRNETNPGSERDNQVIDVGGE